MNPKNPKSMLVGGINRKIYRTFDGGITWDTLVVSFQSSSPTVKMTNVFIHPIDTNIIIVGGINFSTIQRSTDGGKNWAVVLEGTAGGKYPIAMTSEVIFSDAINLDIVYAGDYNSTFLYKSSDKGASWDSISYIKGVNVCTITMLPNTTTMFAGCRTGSIRKSTDTGKTWREVADFTNELYYAEVPTIIFSKKNPNVGYAVSAYDDYKDLPNGGVFKTIDGGETWAKIGYGDTSLWAIAVRTLGWQDDVYIGGYAESPFPEFIIPGQGLVSRSSNSGASWERIDNSIQWIDTVHRNVWAMKFVEDTPQNEKLYMATEEDFM
ncbi:MAG: hypothetical protein JST20_12325 [Bacteroidetes bacterium]|nr:hypothetical protein [Bacteroidota bacterium]